MLFHFSPKGDAIPKYMGGAIPSDNASDTTCPYKVASPHHLLPMAAPLLVAVGTADKDVPPDLVTAFYDRAAAAAGTTATTTEDNLTSSTLSTASATKIHPGKAHPVNASYHSHCCYSSRNTSTSSLPYPSPMNPTCYHSALLLVIPDADHFDVMTAGHSAWKQILEAAEKMLGLW